MSEALLSSAYFGPVQWYQKLNRYDKVSVEAYDSFIKQTYRNRCVIATANGVQALTVPVERTTEPAAAEDSPQALKCLMKDVRISDHGNWRHLHWNALMSAYGESPFFEYYADDIRPFFEKKWTFLYDFNMEICAKMCELIDIEPHIEPTAEFVPHDEWQIRALTTTAKLSAPSTVSPTRCSPPGAIIRCMNSATAFCPTSAYSTCCSTWATRACCIFSANRP